MQEAAEIKLMRLIPCWLVLSELGHLKPARDNLREALFDFCCVALVNSLQEIFQLLLTFLGTV